MLKRFLSHSLLYSVSSVLSKMILLALIPVLTRFFTPAEFGVVDLIAISMTVMTLLVPLEITQAVARFFPDTSSEHEKSLYVSTAFFFTGLTFVLFATVFLYWNSSISRFIFGPGFENVSKIAIISIASSGLFNFLQNQLRWQLQVRCFALITFLFCCCYVVSAIVLIVVFDFGLTGIYYGMIVGHLIGGGLSLILSRSYYHLLFDISKLKKMLKFSLPMVLSGLAVILSIFTDRIAIKLLLPMSDLGLYGIGYRFGSVLGFLIVGVQSALLPLVNQHYKEDSTPGHIEKIFRLFLSVSLPCVLFLVFFSREILFLFVTPEYYTAHSLIAVMGAATLLANMYIFTPGLWVTKNTKKIMYINFFAAFINGVLNFVTIPYWGIWGAAWSTLFAALFAFLSTAYCSQKKYYLPFHMPNIIISLLIVCSLLFVNQYIIINFDLGIAGKCFWLFIGSLGVVISLLGKELKGYWKKLQCVR